MLSKWSVTELYPQSMNNFDREMNWLRIHNERSIELFPVCITHLPVILSVGKLWFGPWNIIVIGWGSRYMYTPRCLMVPKFWLESYGCLLIAAHTPIPHCLKNGHYHTPWKPSFETQTWATNCNLQSYVTVSQLGIGIVGLPYLWR